jgi:hypothetical protein
MDQVLWWTDETHPRSVHSTGNRFIREDSTDAPDTQVVTYEFESFTATWEQRHYAGNNAEQHLIGAYFYGTEGTFHMGWRDGWTFYPAKKSEKPIHVEPQLNDPDGQNIKELWADFLTAIREKRQPVRDIEIGYRATNAALLAWCRGGWGGVSGGTATNAPAMRRATRCCAGHTVLPGSIRSKIFSAEADRALCECVSRTVDDRRRAAAVASVMRGVGRGAAGESGEFGLGAAGQAAGRTERGGAGAVSGQHEPRDSYADERHSGDD